MRESQNMPDRAKWKAVLTVVFVLFFASLGAQAQVDSLLNTVNPPPPEQPPIATPTYTVYLVKPETDATGPGNVQPIIYGQTEFVVNIVPHESTTTHVALDILNTASGVSSEVFCPQVQRSSDGNWHLLCDTMAYQNGVFSIRVRAFGQSGVDPAGLLNLLRGDGTEPLFGPININNVYEFVSPSAGALVQGTAEIKVTLPGSVKSASVGYEGPNTVSGQLAGQRVQSATESQTWIFPWNTSGIPNGQYDLHLHIETLSGDVRNDILTQSVSVDNTPAPCEERWECGAWSDCANGLRVRSCYDFNLCTVDSSSRQESEQCSTPSVPVVNTVTNTQTDNTNTTNETSPAAVVQIPPLVSILSPSASATLAGTVVLSASVQGSAIDSLDFFRDREGGLQNIYSASAHERDGEWSAQWDTTSVQNGTYELYARVATSSKQSYQSAKVRITVDNVNSPSASIPSQPVAPVLDDTDGDGLADTLEEGYGTDPHSVDSDADGVTDSEEIRLGTNPIGAGSLSEALGDDRARQAQTAAAETSTDDPRVSGEEKADSLIVNSVYSVRLGEGAMRVVFQGNGPPNTVVTLFIYSGTPLVITTTTDEYGNYTYILDKSLLDGRHEVYVTVTDESGKIIEKSSPLSFFIREARAVSEEEFLRGDVDVKSSTDSAIEAYIVTALLLILGGFLAFVLARIAHVRRLGRLP